MPSLPSDIDRAATQRSAGGASTLAAAFLALASLAAGPAAAAISENGLRSGLEQFGTVVGDEELAGMRGKFVSPDAVSFFGISMLTSWQDENGITTTARLAFNVDFLAAGNPAPQILVGWSREGDPAMDVSDSHEGYVPFIQAAQVLPIGGLGTTQGAAQANFIAGRGNDALNGMQIAIVPASSMPQLSTGGLQPIDGSMAVQFSDGDELQFQLGDNQIGLALTGNDGLDSSLQSIGGGAGQALQQSMLNSDHNAIFNNTTIVFGTDGLGNSANALRVSEALSSMQGNGF